ncbi:MAG: hypothetical protein LBR26_17585 [Prevotella sp.]|jgi:hypothetical protein|nr:hypothetical protein [Prevotella sp.]
MIDIKIRYQASIFAPSIDATPQNISEMMNLFLDKGVVPTTQQELATLNADAIAVPQLRFSLNSPNNEWVIHFGIERIDISQNQTDAKGNNIGSIEQFSTEASDIFVRIINKYQWKANRLAISGNLILKEMLPQALDEIYPKLFNPTRIYKENKPFEWNFRAVSHIEKKINGNDEILNYITEANRFTGQLNFNQSIVPLDRIAVNLDINTVPNNANNRFEKLDIIDFYSNVHGWYNDLLNELIEKIK